MTVQVRPLDLLRYARAPRPAYREALMGAQSVFDYYEISATRLRAAHFAAQIMHESAALQVLEEDLKYSPARIVAVWPHRFQPKGPLDPADYAGQAEALGNCVYGGRNGNTEPGDGYAFRGRGLLQLSGRAGYQQVTRALREHFEHVPDLCAMPEQVFEPEWAMAVAAALWQAKGCNQYADHDSLVKVTLAINGGKEGLAQRRVWLSRMKKVYGV